MKHELTRVDEIAKYRSGDICQILKYWILNWDIEYWMKYWGIKILYDKPRFHQQDQPFRSCSSAPQSSRSLGSHLKRLPPEQKLWKPWVKNTLKVFYSSITVIKEFHFGSSKKSFPYSNTSSEEDKEVHPENPFWRFYLSQCQASF